MSRHEIQYELPKRIEHYLALLSKLYAQEGKRAEQEVIVNAQPRVHEGWSYDNWNGGIHGHALYLSVPQPMFLSMARKREELQKQIREDINKIHNVQNEFIDEVLLEASVEEEQDWRLDSGLFQSPKRSVGEDAQRRIWTDGSYRLFLSHKVEVKRETAALKERLRTFGASCFVAHEDIHPTKEWQDEIENALASMDAFVALLTEGFHDSLWTDQEVGFAIGRGIPIIAVKLGQDPYGFIGRFQALSCSWQEIPVQLIGLLINQSRMLEAYIGAVEKCSSFDTGNLLSSVLPSIERLTDEQALRLATAFNESYELRGSFGLTVPDPNDSVQGWLFS